MVTSQIQPLMFETESDPELESWQHMRSLTEKPTPYSIFPALIDKCIGLRLRLKTDWQKETAPTVV